MDSYHLLQKNGPHSQFSPLYVGWTVATHIAQNIAETCQKYSQSFIAIEK